MGEKEAWGGGDEEAGGNRKKLGDGVKKPGG